MNPARRLWEAIEPIHAAVYFSSAVADAASAVGLRGWWMGYFAGRFAPMGRVSAPAACASAFGFAPAMVARSLPDAWSYASPEDVLSTRLLAVAAALPPVPAELGALLWTAVDGCTFGGRPLAAAWRAVDPALDPSGAWLAATILREHRGDGHVLAATNHGLTGLETTLTLVATGAVPRSTIQPNRGWTDDDWSASTTGLVGRGVLGADATLTGNGIALRAAVEADTDRLASGPVDALGASGVERVVELAVPLSRRLIDSGAVPVPNPVGVPRP